MAERLLQPGEPVEPILAAPDEAGDGALQPLRGPGETLPGGGVLLARQNGAGEISLP